MECIYCEHTFNDKLIKCPRCGQYVTIGEMVFEMSENDKELRGSLLDKAKELLGEDMDE